MLEKLRILNKKFIEKSGMEKYSVIDKILADDKCFFKMSVEEAYAILRDLGIEEESIRKVYLELIDTKNFYKRLVIVY